MHLEKSGNAKIGLDDLLLHLTGEVRVVLVKRSGEMIKKGELLSTVEHNGKVLRIYSPITGKVMNANIMLESEPEILNEDPYGDGWLCRIKPSGWIAETEKYYLSGAATDWISNELLRFRDFIALSSAKHTSSSSAIILQDGGELCDHALSDMPADVWQDFQQVFLG